MKYLILILSLTLLFTFSTQAMCLIKKSDATFATENHDLLSSLFSNVDTCPQNVIEFKKLLADKKLKIEAAMVANRGIHNPTLGSFSFFEHVTGTFNGSLTAKPGDFFFGHFTDAINETIVLDQSLTPRKLLIELIAWDPNKQLYNFFELIGTSSQTSQWFYRGDSADILADNQYLYRKEPAGTPHFGNRLRCSACHVSGGPIMKELELPHNDWWTTQRPLTFSPNRFSNEVAQIVNSLLDANTFSQSVKRGIVQLSDSKKYLELKEKQTLAEQLRPIFCDTEINLKSDLRPLEFTANTIEIPSEFVITPLLADVSVHVSKEKYLTFLKKYKVQFPETNLADADHAWLTPVKGFSDINAVQSLLTSGKIDAHFLKSAAAVDLENSLLSAKRCSLLQFVPDKTDNWQNAFIENLQKSSNTASMEFLRNFEMTETELNQKIQQFTSSMSSQATIDFENLFKDLFKRRSSVFDAEISKNPRGQILEPGFRVIFPIN